jgi:GGDEF domain-containing protein
MITQVKTQPTVEELLARIAELEAKLDIHRRCPIFNILSRTGVEENWEHRKHEENIAIAVIDIDDMKYANTNYGYDEVNERIKKSFSVVRESNLLTVGRLFNGDEMIIIAPQHEILHPCKRLLQAFKDNGMSVTIVITPYRGQDTLKEATAEANKLMMLRKQEQKGTIYVEW